MESKINKQEKIVSGIVGFAISVFFCFLLPLQTFLANRDLFEFGVVELLWQSGILAFGVGVLLCLLLIIASRFVGRLISVVIVALTFCAYLETGILSIGLPTLNGDPFCFTDILRKIWDAAILAGVFLIFIVCYRYVKGFVHWVAVCTCLMMVASLFDVGVKGRTKKSSSAFSDGFCSPYEVAKSVVYSPIRNVLLISLDAVPGDLVRDILDEEPDLREKFTGFTEYTNVIGMHEMTVRGYPGLITGEYYDPSDSLDAYVQSIFSEKSLLYPYLKVGARLYVNPGCMRYGYTNDKVEIDQSSDDKGRWCAFLRRSPEIPYLNLFDVLKFRLVPYKFKSVVLLRIFSESIKTPNLKREKDLFPVLSEGKIAEDASLSLLCFHTRGVHVPLIYNRNGEMLDVPVNTVKGLKDQTIYVLFEVGLFLDSLRERGVYDVSTVILTTDHGTSVGSADGHCGAPQAFLMIKPTGQKAVLKESSLATDLSRVAKVAKILAERDMELDEINAQLRVVTPRLYRAKLIHDVYYKDVWFDENGVVIPEKSPTSGISPNGWLLD